MNATFNFGIYPKELTRNLSGIFYIVDNDKINELNKSSMWNKTSKPTPRKRYSGILEDYYIIIDNKQYIIDESLYLELKTNHGDNVDIWNAYENCFSVGKSGLINLNRTRLFSNRNDIDEMMHLIKLMLENGITDFNINGIDDIHSAFDLAKTSVTDEFLMTSKHRDIMRFSKRALLYRNIAREQQEKFNN